MVSETIVVGSIPTHLEYIDSFSQYCLLMSKYTTIFEYLQELFPEAKTELHYTNDFQFLIAVMLSAQTTDTQVNKTTDKLFLVIKEPDDIAKMWIIKLTKAISSVNLYKTKAKHIFETAKLLSQQNNIIPNTFEELIKFPGVWEKTAKVVLHVLYKQWVIAVDTHVHRVANRLWIVKTNSPLQTSKLLEKRIPKQYKDIAHDTIVLFWRYHCTARNPHCWTCKLQKICTWYIHNAK